MGRNLATMLSFNFNSVVSSQNSTSANSTGYDMSGYDSILGILSLTSSVAVSSDAPASTGISIYAQSNTDQTTTTNDYVTLENTRVTCSTSGDHTLICEVFKPVEQYIRFVIDGTTAVYSALHVIRGVAKSQPTTAQTHQIIETNVSPSSGTA